MAQGRGKHLSVWMGQCSWEFPVLRAQRSLVTVAVWRYLVAGEAQPPLVFSLLGLFVAAELLVCCVIFKGTVLFFLEGVHLL